jgi:glycosyltransferase involved in cell wall biosynthesis
MTKTTASVSVIFPAFNEAGNILWVLEEAVSVLGRHFSDYEIWVVDDGSSDGTSEAVIGFAKGNPTVRLLRHDRNRGMGTAVRTGIGVASKEWLFTSPADGQFDLAEIVHFVPHMAEGDFLVGCRQRKPYGIFRRINSAINRRLIRLLFGVKFRDTAWVKMIRRDLAARISPESDGFFWETEVLVRARRLGARFVEVEVGSRPRRFGRSSAGTLLQSVKVFGRMLRFRVRLWVESITQVD